MRGGDEGKNYRGYIIVRIYWYNKDITLFPKLHIFFIVINVRFWFVYGTNANIVL